MLIQCPWWKTSLYCRAVTVGKLFLLAKLSTTHYRCNLRGVYSDTTQLNSTSSCRHVHSVNNCQLSMNVVTQLTQFVGRDVINKNTTDLAARCSTGSVELCHYRQPSIATQLNSTSSCVGKVSIVTQLNSKSSWVAINTPLSSQVWMDDTISPRRQQQNTSQVTDEQTNEQTNNISIWRAA